MLMGDSILFDVAQTVCCENSSSAEQSDRSTDKCHCRCDMCGASLDVAGEH